MEGIWENSYCGSLWGGGENVMGSSVVKQLRVEMIYVNEL